VGLERQSWATAYCVIKREFKLRVVKGRGSETNERDEGEGGVGGRGCTASTWLWERGPRLSAVMGLCACKIRRTIGLGGVT
jgi:hypothetical protein